MKDNADGFQLHIFVTQEAEAMASAGGSPRVFADEELSAIGRVSQSYNGHAMVIGCLEAFIELLTQLLGILQSKLLALFRRKVIDTLTMRFAGIALPANGMTMAQAAHDAVHECVDRNIQEAVVQLIVG